MRREVEGRKSGKNKLIKHLHISIKSSRLKVVSINPVIIALCVAVRPDSSRPSSRPSSRCSPAPCLVWGEILQQGGIRLPPSLRGRLPYFLETQTYWLLWNRACVCVFFILWEENLTVMDGSACLFMLVLCWISRWKPEKAGGGLRALPRLLYLL